MHPVLFHIHALKDFPIGTYALMALFALAAGVAVFSWLAAREGQDRMTFVEMGLWAFIIALGTSKIFGAVLDYEPNDPARSLMKVLRFGGHYYIGFLAGSAFLIAFFLRRRIPILKGLDWLAPGLSLAHGIGKIGCLLVGCCYGKACSLPWAVTFTSEEANRITGVPLNVPLHPTQVYEMLAEFVIAPILIWKVVKHPWRTGSTFFTYVAAYGVVRALVEIVRADPRGTFPLLGMPTSQPLAICSALVAIGALIWLARTQPAVAPAAPRTEASDAQAHAAPTAHADESKPKKKKRKR